MTGLISWQFQPLQQRLLSLFLALASHLSRTFVDLEIGNSLLAFIFITTVLLAIVYSFYFLWKHSDFNSVSFLGLLFTIPFVAIIFIDTILGSQQSIVSRYFVPCWISLLIIVGHTIAMNLNHRIGQWLLATILSLSLISCISINTATTGWSKTGDYIPYVAEKINLSPKPLIISGSDWWILSLSHYLRPDIQLEMITRYDILPSIPIGYQDYFLYSLPRSLINSFEHYYFKTASFQDLDLVPVWCLFPPGHHQNKCPAVN